MVLLIPNRIREIKEEGRKEGREEGRKEGRKKGYKEGFEEGLREAREERRRQRLRIQQADNGEPRSKNAQVIAILVGMYDRRQITLDELISLLESRCSCGGRKSE